MSRRRLTPVRRGGDPTDVAARLTRALGSRHALAGIVGRGGMGTVFRARDTRHGRIVAVKVLHPAHVAEAHAALARLLPRAAPPDGRAMHAKRTVRDARGARSTNGPPGD